MENVRSSQGFISVNSCTELSKAQFFPASIVNPNGIRTLLANGLSTFPIKDKPVFKST